MQDKARVIVVSHTYTAPIHRAKLDALARHVSLAAIIPTRWQETLFTVDAQARGNLVASYTLHALPIRFNGHILRYVYPFRAISQIVRDAQPDLFYVEEEPASLSLAQFAWLKRTARLVIFSWENILYRARLPALERWNLAHCDGAICGNREAMQVLRAKKYAKPILVTPQLGVDPNRFSPARSEDVRASLGLVGFVIGYVGRLIEEKGLWTLLSAAESLPDVQLVIIGAGPLRDAMEQWVAARQLGDRVRMIAAVPHEQVARYLNAFDALVLPSQTTPRWKEQFGHILIEAMACRVPVIGSDSGAIPEVIGDAGLVFPEGDVEALRNAIGELKSDPARRARLADAGQARVMAHFTHSHIAAQDYEFFKQILTQ